VQINRVRLQAINAADAMTDDLNPIDTGFIEANPLVKIDCNLDGLGLEQGRPRPAVSGSQKILREITGERIGPSGGRAHVETLEIEFTPAASIPRRDSVLRVVRIGKCKLEWYALAYVEGRLAGCRYHVEDWSELFRARPGTCEDQNRQAQCATACERASHPAVRVNSRIWCMATVRGLYDL
jgi:hypothetical protein